MTQSTHIEYRRTHGFRLSVMDVVVLIIALAGVMGMRRAGHELWWVVTAVVGHFFLFCNVFRVRRSLELIWAGLFLANMAWWQAQGQAGWLPTMRYQAPITLIVIAIEMTSSRYHGIGARLVNRRLDDYLNGTL